MSKNEAEEKCSSVLLMVKNPSKFTTYMKSSHCMQ